MKNSFKRLLSCPSAIAVTALALPIVELSVIAEDTETEEITIEEEISEDLYEDFEENIEDDAFYEDELEIDFESLTMDSPNILAGSSDGICREEWIHELVTAFDMSVEDDSEMINYFSDTSDSPYTYDIDLAANYGVFDVDSDIFDPNGYVTREFAAHTANFCIGYLDDETTVTFSDSDKVYYMYDAVVAIQKGWLSLSSGKFNPNGYITATEAENIITDIKTSLQNDVINKEAGNKVIYQNSVIQLESTANAAYYDGIVTIKNTKATISMGNTFVVTIEGITRIFKASKVSKDSDGNLIINATEVDVEDAVKSLNIQGVADVDYGNVVLYNDAPAPSRIQSYSSNGRTYLSPQGISILAASSDSISISKTIDIDGVSVSLKGSISNIKPEYKLDLDMLGRVDSFYLNTKADANLSATFSGELKNTSSREVKLAEVPVAGAGLFNAKIAITATLSVKGTMTLSYSWDVSGGVSYTKDGGWRTTKNFQKKGFSIDGKVSESLAIKAKISANVGNKSIGEAYIMVGEKADIYNKKQTNGTDCVTLKGYVFAEYGANLNVLGLIKFSSSVQFISEKNSPAKIYVHWENGKLVNKCSFDDDGTKKKVISAQSTSYTNYSPYGLEYDRVISLANSADSGNYAPYQTWTDSRTLKDNITVNGDLYIENSVDLNGHTLTVTGNLIQKGGTMHIGSGTLNVNGDYTITSKTHFDDSLGYEVRDNTGILRMVYANGNINVKGDFHTYSEEKTENRTDYSSYNCFMKGTLTIYGNFYQHSGNGLDDGYLDNNSTWKDTNFKPGSDFNLVFSGAGVHEVNFEGEYATMTGIKETNGATIKITGMLYGVSLKNDIVVTGDMPLTGGVMDLGTSSLTINGNLIHSGGTMNINAGTLNVNGDYKISSIVRFDDKEGKNVRYNTGILRMVYANGNVNVKGDFHTYSEEKTENRTDYSSYNCFMKGTLTIYGNFYQHSGNGLDDGTSNNFYPATDFNLVFSGAGVHEVHFDSTSSNMTGIKEENGATIKLTGNIAGVKLKNDIVVTEDMPLDANTMDLNGKTLTINGNINQNGGIMNVNGGTLIVNGNYTISSRTHYDEREDTTYRDDTGKLCMANATDKVYVKGDFSTFSEQSCSSSSGYNYFNKGTLTIYGNLYQHSGDKLTDGISNNFQPSSAFKIIFSGSKEHIFSSESTSTTTGAITLAKGDKVTFKGNLAGLEAIDKCTFTTDGTAVKISKNTVSSAVPSTGTVNVVNSEGTKKATINFTVLDNITGDANLDGQVTIADVVMLQKWLICAGDLVCWQNVDLCKDNRIDVFDLVLLKRMILTKQNNSLSAQ